MMKIRTRKAPLTMARAKASQGLTESAIQASAQSAKSGIRVTASSNRLRRVEGSR